MTIAKEIFRGQWFNNVNYLENEINNCPNYEIYPLFMKYIDKNSKILENGCGLGRWVIYFHRLGYDITGLDWSEETVDLIKKSYPEIKVLMGDSRATNFEDQTFDVILSLGTFEHSEEGPERAIKESIRILKKGGFLICTMPHYSLFLKLKVFLKEFYRKIKYRGNKYNVYNAYKNKLINKRGNIFPSIMISGLEQPEFFEYYFSHKAFLQFFNLQNIKILEHFTSFGKDGLFFVFKSIIGRWDYSRSQVKLNLLGKIIHSFLPKKLYNIHNVVVVKRIT